jgi:hypothetical protein
MKEEGMGILVIQLSDKFVVKVVCTEAYAMLILRRIELLCSTATAFYEDRQKIIFAR